VRFLTALCLLALVACTPPPPPVPTPTPTPIPTPTPSPTPTPGTTCVIFPDAVWTDTLLTDNQLKDVVRVAQSNVGDVCGRPPDESLCRLAVELDKIGYPSGVTGDAVFVKRPGDGLYEEHHAVFYGGTPSGCWLSNTWRAVWAKADE